MKSQNSADMSAVPVVPNCLHPGDTIGIAAPAGFFDRERLKYGVHYLENKGFRVFLPADIFYRQRNFAGSDIHRALQVEQLFLDQTVKAILCVRGGYGSIKMLPFLDLNSIRSNPKVFMGFSDVTVLLNVFYQHCNLVTFHGPMLNTFSHIGQDILNADISNLMSVTRIELFSQHQVALKKGSAQGKVIGGNLTTICHMVGTPYQPNFDQKILFLEDVNEAGYRIDRMLTQMKLAGCFDKLAGLVLGVFNNCCSETELFSIIHSIFSEYHFPIMSGLQVGHNSVNYVMPIGLSAVLDTQQRSLCFQTAAVKDANGGRVASKNGNC